MAYEDLARLRRQAVSSGHYSDMLRYRDALKRSGTGQAVLDLALPHKWQVVGADRNESYAAVRELLTQLCYDDNGLQPFFGTKARPLTFRETILARLTQGTAYDLWATHLDTCTGIVWEAGGKRFKIVPMHPDLLTASRPANLRCWPANFADTPGTPIRFERQSGNLTIQQMITHPAWLAALEGDHDLLERYARTVFIARHNSGVQPVLGMSNLTPDQLFPLCAKKLDNFDMFADGGLGLGRDMSTLQTRFARVCPP